MQLKNFQGMGMKINLFFFSDGLPRSSVDFFKKEAVGVPFFYTVVVTMTLGGTCHGLGYPKETFGAWIHTYFLL